MINLKKLKEEEVMEFIRDIGLPEFRARQLLHWIYEKHAQHIEEITEFSRDLRRRLSEVAYISGLGLITSEESSDGTTKYLFELEDGERIESVLIPDEDRLTLCISSQVGCALGCRFCRTGMTGFRRNLDAFEITDQVLAVARRIKPGRITNIVFMGMGEPLLNIDNVRDAIVTINRFIGISRRKITVSTAGVAPALPRLADRIPQVNLAVSLNAPDDRTRSMLMPINRKYNLDRLMEACRRFPLPPRRRITFEYVMIRDVNDSLRDADRVARLVGRIPAKVNVIPYNETEDSEFRSPDPERVGAFQARLLSRGIAATVRKSRGADIMAACGQLTGSYEKGINTSN